MGNYDTNCCVCGKAFTRRACQKPEYRKAKWGHNNSNEFCSRECSHRFHNKQVTVPCSWCGDNTVKQQKDLRKSKSGRMFCSKSCAASFNNTQKRKGCRSKMEAMLFDLIRSEFPSLTVLPNDKSLLEGFEVDIAIPEIDLAIEWNGIVHYKPIYGNAKFEDIQQRDAKKQAIAISKGIELIIVPDLVSNTKYLNEAFMNIKKIIKKKIARGEL